MSGLGDDIAGGRDGINRLQSRGAFPTAILCENDWIAIGAMEAVQKARVRVPQDVSVVGYGDLWICKQLDPPLTSITCAEDELVAKAIDLLLEQLEAGRAFQPKQLFVAGEMVWRQSAGPAAERQ